MRAIRSDEDLNRLLDGLIDLDIIFCTEEHWNEADRLVKNFQIKRMKREANGKKGECAEQTLEEPTGLSAEFEKRMAVRKAEGSYDPLRLFPHLALANAHVE